MKNAASDCTHAGNHRFTFESCPLIRIWPMTPPTFIYSRQFGQLAKKSLHVLQFTLEVSTLTSISHTLKSLPSPWPRPLLSGLPTLAAPLRHVSVNGCLKGMLEIRWSRGTRGGSGGDEMRGQTRHTLPPPPPPPSTFPTRTSGMKHALNTSLSLSLSSPSSLTLPTDSNILWN